MSKKKTGNKIMGRLLMAMLSVALVFTMMPLSMGIAFAEDDPAVTAPVEPSGDVMVEESDDSTADVLSAKEDIASFVMKGNVLKQETTVSEATVGSILKTESVTFTGINRKSKRGSATVEKGVYFEDLIKPMLKDGATIESFVVTTTRIKDGSSITEETKFERAEWLMGNPDADEDFNNGKAMLAFEWNDGGAATGTRIFAGCFSDMGPAESGDSEGKPANKPYWIEAIDSIEVIGTVPEPEPEPTTAPTTAPTVQDGQKATVSGSTYTVTSAAAGTATFTKAKKAKTVAIPATVKVNGVTLKVTGIAAKAFKGTKTKTIVVKTKGLTKKSVKGSLKGSKVKTVKVKIGSKKVNKKYVKKYKKIFTKKNAGKKVKVKR